MLYLVFGFIIICAVAVIANLYTKYKMVNEECAALREQLYESDPDTAGYGIHAIKPRNIK